MDNTVTRLPSAPWPRTLSRVRSTLVVLFPGASSYLSRPSPYISRELHNRDGSARREERRRVGQRGEKSIVYQAIFVRSAHTSRSCPLLTVPLRQLQSRSWTRRPFRSFARRAPNPQVPESTTSSSPRRGISSARAAETHCTLRSLSSTRLRLARIRQVLQGRAHHRDRHDLRHEARGDHVRGVRRSPWPRV